MVAYLPLKPGAPEIPSYLTEEMPQATFSDGVKTRAVSAKSAPCFFDGATTGMTVVMLAQEQVCRQKTEIKVTGFVFPLPDSFDYQLKRQVIALQLTDQYLVP